MIVNQGTLDKYTFSIHFYHQDYIKDNDTLDVGYWNVEMGLRRNSRAGKKLDLILINTYMHGIYGFG